MEEAPAGTNWIADQRLKRYYPVSCAAVRALPRPDRLYYATESAVRQPGYVQSPECAAEEARSLEDAPPRLQDPPASAAPTSHPRRGFWFSGGLQLGGSVSRKVLLGGGTTGWTRSEGGVTLTTGNVGQLGLSITLH